MIIVDAGQISALVSASQFALTIVLTVGSVTWTISRIVTKHRASIARDLAEQRQAVTKEITALRDTVNSRVAELTQTMADHEMDDERRFSQVDHKIDAAGDLIRNEFGETAKAIREHVSGIAAAISDGRLATERLVQAKHDNLDARIRALEIEQARGSGRRRET